MADIEMPQLGETVTEGTITQWLKKVGDTVEADEPLFEVSTDKVDSEVPSSAAGTLTEILVAEGETVDVGTKLAVIGDAASGNGAAPAADAEPATEPAQAPSAPPESAPVAAAASAPAAPPAPAAPAPAPPAAAPAPAASSGGGARGKLLSPVVRRLIAEHGLDADAIDGTGVGGRITRNDVQKLVDAQGNGQPAPAPAAAASSVGAPPPVAPPAASVRPVPAPAPTAAAAGPLVSAGAGDQVVPFTNIRKRTAEHMTMSKQTSAHVYVSTEVDFEGVDRVRKANRETFKAEEGFSLTYLPFVTRAVVDAIREFPEVNASVGDNALVVHGDINIGIAVDLDFKGLIVPVIHGADAKRMRGIARDISDLANRARTKKLGADDIQGGTFTITNPGPFGTLVTLPIINQPQVAILSTDGVKRRPVVVEGPDGSEAIAIHSVGNLALAWDHRAFDGAYASAFLRAVQQVIETRDWQAEL